MVLKKTAHVLKKGNIPLKLQVDVPKTGLRKLPTTVSVSRISQKQKNNFFVMFFVVFWFFLGWIGLEPGNN